jgi:thiol-disulfide isomerase/thioredoxin
MSLVTAFFQRFSLLFSGLSSMLKGFQPKPYAVGLMVLTLLSVGVLSVTSLAQQTNKKLVVFTASWNANCQDLLPILTELSTRHKTAFVLIDVEAGGAPKEAGNLGLAIPHRELPQVYLLKTNTATLIVDGNDYKLGQSDAVKAQLEPLLKD